MDSTEKQQEQFIGYAALKPFDVAAGEISLVPYKFDPRPLDGDEVEISILACGICGSDVHQLTNGWKRAHFPLIPGHEFIGRITAIGTNVHHLKLNDRVGVSPVCRSCDSCEQCQDGFRQLCYKKVSTYGSLYKGYRTYGGYSNKARVQANWAIKIPDNISSEEGAPLLCAGITTYLPFIHQNIGENSVVGMVGIGGLGHLAIQWARAKKCKKVVAVSSTSAKAAEATELGATDFIALKKNGCNKSIPPEYLKSLDVLLVCGSGKSTNWDDLLSMIKTRGKLILLDLPDDPVPLTSTAFVLRHISIIGSFVGSSDDLYEMLAFASETGVRPWINKIGNTLDDVNQGIDRIMNGKAHYRLVICGEGRN
ncbi:chaperonin 10-like protein [Phascolomyces articulosus]|uniref:Chaperonin 10-like protein n=1 Tax=Phascolomyces articulosus TaxID=60185 RepID=A0AAD5K2L0_9FUNG|nr:chaperonin 10-like protein [Phascolomyces articulosus]